MWTVLKAWWTWSKWTIQSLFLPKDSEPERPGDDNQFDRWLHETERTGRHDD